MTKDETSIYEIVTLTQHENASQKLLARIKLHISLIFFTFVV